MATPRELPLSPPQSSGGELTPERASDSMSACVSIYIPNGMEHVKMDEFAAGSSSMIYASPPSYFQPHGYPTPMPASTPVSTAGSLNFIYCAYMEKIQMHMHMGHTVVHTPPPGADDSMAIIESSQVHSPSGRRASPPKAKLSRSTRERNNRARRGTTTKNDLPLSAPLSELTAHMTNIPLRDMDAWVHRSTEVRLQEKAEKGKVARPMNSFMLYRSAYAERSKRLLSQNNHQVVSSTAGRSWKMEPAEIRDKYEELARIEREAHSRAHPTYKFKPNKGPATTTRRRGELTPPTPAVSGSYDDTPSPFTNTWEDEYSMVPPMHCRTQSFEYPLSSRASTPFGSPDSFITHGSYLSSSWNTSHPGMPTVQPHALNMGYAEDVQFRRGSPMSQEVSYGASNGLAGLPGGTHDDLLQPQAIQLLPGQLAANGHMDPQLLNFQSDALPIPAPNGPIYAGSNFPPSEFTSWGEIPPAHSSPMQYPISHMADDYFPNMHHDPSLAPWIHQHETL
ncbi:High mobility group superfamily [Penicillium sp. IBT 18751x]|nr:High mobility group superfamily [Penicillium sp. IBT 18751x]